MCDSNSIMALNDFKKQLDALSESLNHFDPTERSKALEILQECIQGLETKSSFTLAEDLNEAIINSLEGISEDKQNNESFCIVNEEMCQGKPLSVGRTGTFEEVKNKGPGTSSVKEGEYSSIEDSCEELNTSEEKIEDEGSEGQSEEESEFQSEEDCKSSLKCPKCEEEYNSKPSFLEHLQSYSGKTKSCVDCHKVFRNSVALKFHKQLNMCLKTSKMFKCKLCNKMLLGSSQYNTHLSAHKRNQCKTCGDHFARRKHLDAHIVNVHNGSVSKDLFRCHICERTFTQRRSLVYHYKISHPGSDLVCPVCLEMFYSSTDLETHKASHKQQTFVCDKCNSVFSRRQQYLVHMKEHERYKCETCSEGFSAKKAAVQHARLGHKVSGLEPQLQCAQCGEMFFSRPLLNSHMIQHTGGKTLSCEKCKLTFKYERNYRSHLETDEHLRGEEPKTILACKDCSKTFTNKNNLRVHVSRMHNANLKEHSCTHCSYKTTTPNNLKRHIALHTERPQFICDKCGAQFQTKSALQDHHSAHTDNKNFSCDKCGTMFGRSSELKRHLLNIHSDVPLHLCHCGNKYKSQSNLRRHQLLTHGEDNTKQKRLKKLFPLEINNPPKKKVKKNKTKTEATITNNADLQLLNSQMPAISTTVADSNTVVMLAERHPDELMQVSYNMDFTGDGKSQVVYTQNLDMSGLQVVESMIQLDEDASKQGTSVLINVRNLFGRDDYIMPSTMETSMVGSSLPDETQHITVTNQKQEVDISGLQQFIIPHELNFLNV